MNLPIQTHLITRNGTYYFRRRIPSELLKYYSPKLEVIFSLKTKDLREAERLSRAESARLDIEFDRLKNNLTPLELLSLSKEDIKWTSPALLDVFQVPFCNRSNTIGLS